MKKLVKTPRPPLPLFTMRADGIREEKCFACGECGTVTKTKEIAEQCCKQTYCTCGAETPQYMTLCSHCRDKKMWDAAEEIEEWDGPVFDESREKWFESFDEALEYYEEIEEEDDGSAPEFLQPCNKTPFPGIDTESVLETLTENMFEDAYDHLKGIEELEAAVKIFNEKNKSLVSWYADSKKKIRVPETQSALTKARGEVKEGS
jgi:hypothetical protein